MPKTSTEPETAHQAAKWERVKNRYLRAGLCLRCASQAAWGHQCGFLAINPPCDDCAGVELPAWLTDHHGLRAVKWLRRVAVDPSESTTEGQDTREVSLHI